MIYLYAITDQSAAIAPNFEGLEGTKVFSLTHRDIAAIVGPVSRAHVAVNESHLWQHEAVIEQLMTNHAVLPVRFGTVLADEMAIQHVLSERYVNFVSNLKRMRGRVELGLRVLWNNDLSRHKPMSEQHHGSTSADGVGRTYMLMRLEDERLARVWRQQAEELAWEVHAPLAALAVEHVHKVLVVPRLLLTAAYLVDQPCVAAFQFEVDKLSVDYPGLRFLATGPWPAYSFVVEQ